MVVKLNHDIIQKLYQSAEKTLLTAGTKSMHTLTLTTTVVSAALCILIIRCD